MPKPSVIERQLPYGVADLYFEDAARKAEAEAVLQETFRRWSYTQVIPPTFEYYEALAAEASPQVREEIYRFADRDGRMLALRADPTIPIARIVGTKLYAHPLPLRFFYISNVFRYEEPKAALRREFTQAGIELIGAGTPEADAEVIALAITALRAIGLRDLRVRLGAMNLVDALLADLALTETEREFVKHALERKNERRLRDLLYNGEAATEAPTDNVARVRNALCALAHLTGDGTVLERARHECAVNEGATRALERLHQVWHYLVALDCADALLLDLAMVRGMAYYTGIVFEGFARGVGFAVLSGGRYDRLLAHFGRDLPACGFAIGVERALAARQAQGEPPLNLAPEIIAELSTHSKVNANVMQARQAGRRVEHAVCASTRAELVAYARRRGAREVWFADGTREVLG